MIDTIPQRIIELKFKLGKGDFGADGVDTVEVKGLRTRVSISNAGQGSNLQFDVRVEGMSLDLMNKLTQRTSKLGDHLANQVEILAGDTNGGVGVIAAGQIFEAWADLTPMPDSFFHLTGFGTVTAQFKPVAPISFSGGVDIATAGASIAQQMRYQFVNNGVIGKLRNPYFHGTAMDQLNQLQKAAGFECNIDSVSQTITIWPRGKSSKKTSVVISRETGLLSYPTFNSSGISVVTIFNPAIDYGHEVKVQCEYEMANGYWKVWNIKHELESEVPDGKWYTHLMLNRPDAK